MSKKEEIKWGHCLFIATEFDHYTFNGNGIYTAYFLAHDTIFHKFRFVACTQLANELQQAKPLKHYDLVFKWARNEKVLLSATPCND
jgi:hypothetical protein